MRSAAAVVAIIDAEQPDVIVTLDGSDGHRDHLQIRRRDVDRVAASRVADATAYTCSACPRC